MSSNNEGHCGVISCVEFKAIALNSTETTCDSSQFTCESGDCVPGSYRCDGDFDCGDYSDEIGCGMFIMKCDDYETIGSPATCQSSAFTCDNGQCAPYSFRCDGHYNCGDYSDEVGCGMFKMMCDITHNKTYWFPSNLSFLCIFV